MAVTTVVTLSVINGRSIAQDVNVVGDASGGAETIVATLPAAYTLLSLRIWCHVMGTNNCPSLSAGRLSNLVPRGGLRYYFGTNTNNENLYEWVLTDVIKAMELDDQLTSGNRRFTFTRPNGVGENMYTSIAGSVVPFDSQQFSRPRSTPERPGIIRSGRAGVGPVSALAFPRKRFLRGALPAFVRKRLMKSPFRR